MFAPPELPSPLLRSALCPLGWHLWTTPPGFLGPLASIWPMERPIRGKKVGWERSLTSRIPFSQATDGRGCFPLSHIIAPAGWFLPITAGLPAFWRQLPILVNSCPSLVIFPLLLVMVCFTTTSWFSSMPTPLKTISSWNASATLLVCFLPGARLIPLGFHDSILSWFSLNLSAHSQSPFSACLLASDAPRIPP